MKIKEYISAFYDTYMTDEKIRTEQATICSHNQLPKELSREWNLAVEELAYNLCEGNEYIQNNYADIFLQTIKEFIASRIDYILCIKDFVGAFEFSYQAYFPCISYIAPSHLKQSDTYTTLLKICNENWNAILQQIPIAEQKNLLNIYWHEVEDVYASETHKKLNPTPYFQFLKLPWHISFKDENLKRISEFNDNYKINVYEF